MATHTPGPWHHIVADDDELLSAMRDDAAKVKDRVAGIIFTQLGGAEGYGQTIATINARRETFASDGANARLIAAAPDMLAALQAYCSAYDETTGTIHVNGQIRKAIRKALGDEQ